MRRRRSIHANFLQAPPIAVLSFFKGLQQKAIEFRTRIRGKARDGRRATPVEDGIESARRPRDRPRVRGAGRGERDRSTSFGGNAHEQQIWNTDSDMSRNFAPMPRLRRQVAVVTPNGRAPVSGATPMCTEAAIRARFGRKLSEFDFEEQRIFAREQRTFSREQRIATPEAALRSVRRREFNVRHRDCKCETIGVLIYLVLGLWVPQF
jgi:hypothetical protein